MITIEQAKTAKYFRQVKEWNSKGIDCTMPLDKPKNWQASGKCKTWKTRPNEFKLPIKFGLYKSAYLTHENACLFEIVE